MNSRWPFPRWLVLGALLTAGMVLGLVSFGQEAYLGYRLSHQVAQMRQQNAALAGQNAGYRRDISALNSGAGAEEQERLNGYARKGEQMYLVGQPPAAPATGKPKDRKPPTSGGGVIETFRRWIANLWHG